MRRLFWLGVGLAIGALAFRKLSQMTQRATPGSLAQSLGSGLAQLSEAIRDFTADVRANMHEHEIALREGAGLDAAAAPRHAGESVGRTAGQ